MIKKLKRIFVSLSAIIALAVPALTPVAVHAQTQIQGGLCEGSKFSVAEGGTSCEGDTVGETGIQNIIETTINVASILVGVVAVIMIIFGGLRYITSGGDSGNISSAKNTIIFAVVGLVVVALAQIIVRFVLSRTGNLGE